MGQIGISALELWGAVFCLLAAVLIDRGKIVEHRENKQLGLMLLINALVLVCDVFAIVYNGEPGKLGLYVVGIANFWLYFLIYTLEIYFIRYLRTIIEVNGGKFSIGFAFAGAIIMSFSLVVLIANIWTKHLYYFDIKNFYHRGPYYSIAMIPVFLCFVIIGVIVIYYRKYFSKLQILGLIIYLVFPVSGAIVMAFSKETSSFINISITLALLMMYGGYEVEKNKRMLAQANELVEKERINEEFRNLMLWTQIQPHFIYNNLNVIQYLCNKDPELAGEAVAHLSAFLRSYIDAYDLDVCIPITEEIEIINHYLYMQKLRYGDRLQVDFKVEKDDFYVPPLSVECLVENAVRHGVAKKEEGGMVSIHVYETEEENIVEIEDNGVGFDSKEIESSEQNHVGIRNTNSRLKYMIKGSLEVISQVGEGCRAVIHIPKRK